MKNNGMGRQKCEGEGGEAAGVKKEADSGKEKCETGKARLRRQCKD